MSTLQRRFTRLSISLAFAAALTLGAALPAFADNGVSLTVNAGTRTASVGDLGLTAIEYSHSAQTQTGTMTLTADDSTGSGAGWNVTIQSSAFNYTGSSANGSAIPAANFSITTAHDPAKTAGQAIDATNGPKVPGSGATGTLDSAHKVIQANAAYGLGTYTQALDVSLAVPAQSRAGDYSATLTVSITAAP
jgi:hypothetical protein